MKFVTLNNNIEIPNIGFGTYLLNGQECIDIVKKAIEIGYRHIDTAARYQNEKEIGQALKETNIPRDQLFITSKVWVDCMGYDNAMESFNRSLHNLDLEYIDLFLIHWPNNQDYRINVETWRALEHLYKEGKVKAIGMSNFLKHHLEPIIENCEIKPMVNQLEYHPGLVRKDTIEFCKKHNILIEAWAPLGKGTMINNEDLEKIAKKYNKSVAQLCIKWCLQNEAIPLPKSSNISRIKENFDVFDFTIEDEDMEFINKMEAFVDLNMDPDDV